VAGASKIGKVESNPPQPSWFSPRPYSVPVERAKTHIVWNSIEAFDLLDAPNRLGVNKQLEGKQSDKTKAQTLPKRRCPDQLAAAAC
jgi:hypothetical protein